MKRLMFIFSVPFFSLFGTAVNKRGRRGKKAEKGRMSRAGAVWRDLCADRRKDAIAIRGTGEGGKKKEAPHHFAWIMSRTGCLSLSEI